MPRITERFNNLTVIAMKRGTRGEHLGLGSRQVMPRGWQQRECLTTYFSREYALQNWKTSYIVCFFLFLFTFYNYNYNHGQKVQFQLFTYTTWSHSMAQSFADSFYSYSFIDNQVSTIQKEFDSSRLALQLQFFQHFLTLFCCLDFFLFGYSVPTSDYAIVFQGLVDRQ